MKNSSSFTALILCVILGLGVLLAFGAYKTATPFACARNSNPLVPVVNPVNSIPTVVVTGSTTPSTTPIPTVQITDSNLQAALGQVLYSNGVLSSPSDTITADKLATLTSLSVDNAGVTSLEGLEYCTSLTDLEVSWNNITDLTPISGLTGLNTLNLTANPVTDLTPISGLTNLTSLEIGYSSVTSLSPIAGLTNLQVLEAYNIPISDLSPVTGLTQLVELNADADQIAAIPSGMNAMTNLQNLELYANPLTRLPNLSGCVNLQSMDIDNCQITDLSPVTLISNLVLLAADNNPLNATLRNLSSMVNLQCLEVGNCGLIDITGLSGMTILGALGVENNRINDIDPLVSAQNAGSFGSNSNINLSGNPMGAESANADWNLLVNHGVIVQGTEPQAQ